MKVAVTGAAGFIGSNLVDALLARGDEVVGIDNLSTGTERFLESARHKPAFKFARIDLTDPGDALAAALRGTDAVVHLAANADVRFGWNAPERDLRENVVATHTVLETMRREGVRRIVFSSTGSVYGEASVFPTPEDAPFPLQTSLYGASKLAAEGFVEAYAEGAGISASILRFVSILGPRYTHGHVVDFMRKLHADASRLEILGDGRQRKSYLDVSDCIAAVVQLLDASHKCEVFNLGVDDYCTVTESASWICERLGVQPELSFTGGTKGWVGDSPFIFLDTSKMQATGWKPRYAIREAVERTVDYLRDNMWVLERPEARA